MRITAALILVNYIAFASFIALRPSRAAHLHEKDAALARGELSMSTADPFTYIAARPLYNWSEWHGGERLAVKLLEVANLPALLMAGFLTPAVSAATGTNSFYWSSQVRALLFFVFATAQWIVVGFGSAGLKRILRKRPNS
jgi:hypothetical protein